jgi:hypothetical protein
VDFEAEPAMDFGAAPVVDFPELPVVAVVAPFMLGFGTQVSLPDFAALHCAIVW